MYIVTTVHIGHAHKMRGSRWADDKNAHVNMTEKVSQNMGSYAKVIEDRYFVGPWVLGEKYSMCDPYLLLVTRWLCSDGCIIGIFSKTESTRKTYAY